MKFEVKIDKLVAGDPADEAATALLKVAGMVRSGKTMGPVFDQNGNRIGGWSFTAEKEDGDGAAKADD